jgi:hypothetical protein
MRFLGFTLLLVLLFSLCPLHAQGGHPIPAGARQADRARVQAEKNIPPPLEQQTSVDMAKLGQEADELARIAQTIPLDVASVQKGMLPKDVLLKLKQIEKLSKRLRSKLDR